jgi:hypothetical protein
VILEHELTEALNRKQPPPGMVERVMARIDSREAPAVAPSFRQAHWTRLRLGIALVLLVMIGFGVVRQREVRREQQQAEFATRQLMTALQIASEALNDAKRMVQR